MPPYGTRGDINLILNELMEEISHTTHGRGGFRSIREKWTNSPHPKASMTYFLHEISC
jgi:hypothetical protein